MRTVRIQCTIGPSCSSEKILADMIAAGMDGARVNLSHGSAESQKDKLVNFRRAAASQGTYEIPIMFDIRGPEVRIGEIEDSGRTLIEGETVTLHCGTDLGDEDAGYSANILPVNYSGLCREVVIGTEILIDDGRIRLFVEDINDRDIICTVETGGTVKSRKGVNVPDIKLHMDYLGDDDCEDILWCIANRVDYIAGSFIRRADDVRILREFLDDNGGKDIGIIAKIECKEAISNIEAIAGEADQILVARGDMGVEIGFEKVPAVQKRIIRRCREAGKAVIVATQLIESMTENPVPTRAEVSDIANAVYDGATDLLVTGETAAGKYPVEVVKEMAGIIQQAEQDIERYGEEIL